MGKKADLRSKAPAGVLGLEERVNQGEAVRKTYLSCGWGGSSGRGRDKTRGLEFRGQVGAWEKVKSVWCGHAEHSMQALQATKETLNCTPGVRGNP